MVGDIRNEPVQYVFATPDDRFLIQFVEGEPTDPDNVIILTNQGSSYNDYTIANQNIVNLRDTGFVDEFVIFNVAIGSTSNYVGIVMNITNGTIYQLTEDLTFITPQIGDATMTTFFREGNLIHAYGIRGTATIDLDTLSVTREDSTPGNISTVSYEYKPGILADDLTLIVKYVEPLSNPNFTATLTLFSANLTEGIDNFVTLGQGQLDTLSISNSLFALTEDSLVQINRTTQEMFTVFAVTTLEPAPYYLINQTYYRLTETYEEVNTNILQQSTFVLF
jgi:hypothetical protein